MGLWLLQSPINAASLTHDTESRRLTVKATVDHRRLLTSRENNWTI